MARLSLRLADVANEFDGLAGKYLTAWQSRDDVELPRDFLEIIAGTFFEGVAQGMEYGFARPVFYLENLFLGKSTEEPPVWNYSRRRISHLVD